MRHRPAFLPLAPLLTIAVLLLPVGAGLAGVLAPAFGWYPALGGTSLSLDPWRALLDWPGLPDAVWLSLTTGLGATFLSLLITVMICAAWQGTRAFAVIERALSPLLSVPHAAAAFGLAFLIAPSGWIARALSPWATGWDQPPDILITQDPHGPVADGGAGGQGSAVPAADDAGRPGAGARTAVGPAGADHGLRAHGGLGADGLSPALRADTPAGLCGAGLFLCGDRRGADPWADAALDPGGAGVAMAVGP